MRNIKRQLFNKRDFFIIFLIFLLSLLFFLLTPPKSGEWVEITKDGKTVFSAPLSNSFEKTLDCGVVIVCDGKSAYFKHSDCPDKVCIKAGKLSVAGQWAACLPNGTLLKIKGKDGSADTVS